MKKILLPLILLLSIGVSAQNITWTDVSTTYNLQTGIKLYSGVDNNMPLRAKYIDIDLNNPRVSVRSYAYSGSFQNVRDFCSSVGAVAAINGGFFGSGTPYSAIVEPDGVSAKNIAAVSRDGKYYPITRGFFGINADREMSIDWVYHFGNNKTDIYSYTSPAPNVDGTPAAAPVQANGTQLNGLYTGVGGGPILVKNGSVYVTYTAEVIWGSGVSYSSGDPRTAVGYTADNHVIMIVVDGRQTNSVGVSLPQLAQIMVDLGCVEALNLDGGGSSQMAVGSQYVSSPSEYRAVSSILAVNYDDSQLDAPTLVSPQANAENQQKPVNLVWDMPGFSGCDFRVQVSTNLNGWSETDGFSSGTSSSASIPVNCGTATDTEYSWSATSYGNPYGDPEPGQTYYWTVRAYKSDLGVSKYSVPQKFTMGIATPNLVLPENNATVSQSVDFSWESIYNNASFRIQVAKSIDSWTKENGFTASASATSAVPVNAGTGAGNYTWENGTTGSFEAPLSGTTYYWTVRSWDAVNGTSYYSTPKVFTVIVDDPDSVTVPSVCVVTVDNATNKNLVTWVRETSNAIKSYNIYRETFVSGEYELIGNVTYNSENQFVDNNSNPAQKAERYKISAVDIADNETELSEAHKPIHLNINKSSSTGYNLIWNVYEGFLYDTYTIYRGTTATNLSQIAQVAGNLTSFTDVNPPAGDVFYAIEVVSPNSCTVSSLKSKKYASSMSNMVKIGTATAISDNINAKTLFYPNPAKNELFIQSANNTSTIEIIDLFGRSIKQCKLENKHQLIDISTLKQGIYILKENDRIVGKFMKE